MHVLVIPSWYPTAQAPQAGIYFAEQIQTLARHGLQMGVVFPEQQSLRRWSRSALSTHRFQVRWHCEDGIPTLRRHSWNVLWRLPLSLPLRVRDAEYLARRYVKRFGTPDVVHAHSAQWAGAAAARIAGTLDRPYVLTEHFSGFQRGAIFSWQWPLVRTGFRRADAVSVVSTTLKNELVTRGLADDTEVMLLPNMVDTTFFALPPEPRIASPFRFFTLAHISPRKRIDLLINAFASAFRADPRVQLLIGGDGPALASLERLARKRDVADQVTFLGALSRPEVRRALWRAHAFALPSDQETFGVVLIEAMATGLPLVATRSGGPEDIVTATTGCLVPTGDVNALARVLRDVHDNWTEYDPAAIRARAVRRFGPETFVRRTLSLYRRAREAHAS